MENERIPIHVRTLVRQASVVCDQGQSLSFAVWRLVGPLGAGEQKEGRELVVTIEAEFDREGERRKRKINRTLDAGTVRGLAASLSHFFECFDDNARGFREAEFSMQVTPELTVGLINSRPPLAFVDVKAAIGSARLQTEDVYSLQHFTFSPR